jgi:hypothetical protein
MCDIADHEFDPYKEDRLRVFSDIKGIVAVENRLPVPFVFTALDGTRISVPPGESWNRISAQKEHSGEIAHRTLPVPAIIDGELVH